MIIRKFNPEDLKKLIIQPEQQEEYAFANPIFDFTIETDGVVLGVFGVMQTGEKRLCVSSFISKRAGKHMLSFVRTIKRLVEDGMIKTGNKILDMSVRSDFVNGKKLALLLGFSFNQTLPTYFHGKDYELYTRYFQK